MVEHPDKVDGANIAPRTEIPHEGLYPPPPAREIHTGRAFGYRFTREEFNCASRWTPTTPTPLHLCKTTMGQQTHNTSLRQEQCSGFSESPASGGVDAGQWTEDEIAEAIFDWWISGKPYKQWYSDKYLQQEIEFDTE